jgi:CoA:oxalate CoA-transferase
MTKALGDIVILDLTQVLAGPFAVTMLGDFGADIIKIEPPQGDFNRHLFASQPPGTERLVDWSQRRNRRGITLNLRSEKGKDIFLEMVKKADVVVENFSTGTMDKLGLGYAILKGANPDIIYCAMSGFGQTGPYKDELAYDPIIQAASGIMALTGFPQNPPVRVGMQIADIAGAVYAVIGILLALHNRSITGKGQMIDCAMFDGLSHWTLVELFAGVNITGKDRIGNEHPMGLAGSYETKDGHNIVLAILSDNEWNNFLKVIGKEDVIAEKWNSRTRLQNKDKIEPWIKNWLKGVTLDQAGETLTRARIAHHRVTRLQELKADPQVADRKLLIDVDDPKYGKMKVRGLAPRLSETPGSIGTADRVPELGQHTEEVLAELLGYGKKEATKLREEGVI